MDFNSEMKKRRQVRRQQSEGTLKSSYTDEAVDAAKKRQMIEKANANRAQWATGIATKQRFRQREIQSGLERFRQDRERRNAEAQNRAGAMDLVRDSLSFGGGSALADAVSYGRNLVEDNSWREPNDKWQREWLEEFGYRYNTDPEDAFSFAQQVNDYLKAGELQTQQKQLGEMNPLLATGVGLATAPLGMADPVEKLLEKVARGTITQRGHVTPATLSRDLTGAVAQNLNEKHGTIDEDVFLLGGKGWGDLYGIFNSAVQSMGLGHGLGSLGTLATYFGQSAGGGMEEIKARGGSDEQAILYGLANGAFEVLAEYLPLGNLLKGGDAVHYTLKSFLGNAMKQAGFEGTEEAVTSIANGLTDHLIMGDKSNFAAQVQAYMAQGMDEEAATRKAWLKFAGDTAFDFLGGALSGAGSMAVQTGPSTVMANHQTRRAYTPEMEAGLLELAMETEEGSRPYALAQEYQNKGEKLTGGQINQLAGVYEEYTDAQDADALTEDAAGRLEALDAENDTAARAIAKTIVGQELTRAERKALQNSAEAKKVLQDMREGRSPRKSVDAIVRERIQHREEAAPVQQEAAQDPLAAKLDQAGPVSVSEQLVTENATDNVTDNTSNATDNATAVLDNTANAAETVAEPVAKPVAEPAEAAVENVENPTAETADSAPTVEENAENTPSSRTVEEVAEGFGNQAGEVRKMYQDGQDVDVFEQGVRAAWELGNSGIPMERAVSSPRTQGITEHQRKQAYLLGQGAARLAAQGKATANAKAATGGTVRRRGAVKGQGVSIQDLSKTFNDPQKSAYKLLNFYAEVTGVDVVLYKGKQEQETGRFAHGEDTIYIDITAGTNGWDATDLGAYTMMRTFSHEFTHFVEKWNPTAYNDLREAVFAEMEKNGSDPEALVEIAMQEQGLTFDQASREVVAEALTDILPESQFVQTLAQKHKSLFDKLKERLEAFVSELKAHWKKLTGNNSREAVALKRQVGEALSYAEEIVQLFDRVAGEAVEAYQATVSEKETVREEPKVEEKPKTEKKPALPTQEKQEQKAEPPKAKKTAPKFDESMVSVTDERFGIHPRKDGGLVVAFTKKAPDAVRQVLKDRGFKWKPKGKHWEGKGDKNEVADALRSAYGDTPAEVEAEREKPVAGGKPTPATGKESSEPDFEKDPYGWAEYQLNDDMHYGPIDLGAYEANIQPVNYDDRLFFYRGTLHEYKSKNPVEVGERVYRTNLSEKREDVVKDMVRVLRKLEAYDKGAPKDEDSSPAAQEMGGNTPSEKLANAILSEYLSKDRVIDSMKLYALADRAFGGTQGEGAYNRKDAYDALELAVNKYLLDFAKDMNGDALKAQQSVRKLEELLRTLPTQTVRTQEQQDFQQFSTPPNIAYLAAWAGNVQPGEMVLEPSAGIGGIASFAKSWGAEVAVNELSERRLGILKSMGFDHVFNENAEQLDNVLPDHIKPTLVLMNPPFSSTAGRTKHNKTSNAERHIDQALQRLSDGGRLVAILGKGMNDADYRKYWDKVRKEYTIRANLSIDGSNYKKYGTTWGVQLVVIDKVGPQTGQTITGSHTDLTEVPAVLEEIRNDRKAVERPGTDSGAAAGSMAQSDGQHGVSEAGSPGGRVRDPGKPARTAGKRSDHSHEGGSGVRNHADDGGLRKPQPDSGKSEVGGDVRQDLRPDHRADHEPAVAGELARPEPQRTRRLNEESEQREDDGVYATFVLPDVPIPGGRKHPATLVESAAMSAVSMPKATYTPKLPAEVVKNNLSDAQMVTVTYAGQAHSQMLPDGSRKGFFIGDGTGVGKGRQIAGIILDNFMQGRTKAVWVSKNGDLYNDAIRDWTGTTGRSKDEVLNHGKTKLGASIAADSGILFTTYPMLRSGKNNVTRLDQIVSWLGEDFDGVIAFDEAHNMGNLYGKKGKFGKAKGSEMAKAGVELQRRLPKARIVYVSATAATEVENLAYAERLGLWGKGTAFTNAQDFISKIGSSGLSAMELVVRDMKAMGSYVARSISYQGVAYDTIEHTLDENQTIIYNTMSSAWQTVMQNVHKALELTGGKNNSHARQLALGQFYSSMQRFYNQALTSMSMPSVIADMRRELAAGRSCVLQIVNTNEAQQNKALAQAKAENLELDDLDLTPRESLIGYLETCFPVQEFEEYTDEEGHTRSRPALDSKGQPIISRQAVAMRNALIEQVKSMAIPDGPMEMLFDAFGTEMVAENTGRSRRVVPKRQSDGSVKRVEERRTLNSRTADVQAFQDGKKRVLVFSDAGGTGKSYHADRSEKNQQQRIHYVLQPGWSASNAVQGFGRTHRSNEASAPIYKLVTTNIKGQKRFTSTIARRLDQLGALTKGQRDTGSGMFGAKDNLETDLARDSLREFYKRLGGNRISGIDGMKTLDRLGLKEKFTDDYGSFKMDENTARDISTFLNRILALEVDEQNTVFDAFTSIYEMELEAAIQAGTLDTGMENVKADKIEILDDKIIREDGNGGAATHYIQAKTYKKPRITTTVVEAETQRSGFVGIYETDNGSVRAVYRMADKTTEWGQVTKQYRLVGPNRDANTTVWQENTLAKRAKLLDKKDWQRAWDKEVAQVPEYNEDTLHMLTGALLPIWDKLPQEGTTKVKRLIAADGRAYLGRQIPASQIDLTLRQFQTNRTAEKLDAATVMDRALQKGEHFRLTRERAEIFRSRVSGEWRLEIRMMNAWQLQRYSGIIRERINFQDRFFIPKSEIGEKLLADLLEHNPVRDSYQDDQLQVRRIALTDRQVLELAAERIDPAKFDKAGQDAFRIFSERLERLRTLQEDRKELGHLYKEQQFGPNGDRKAAAETLEKMYQMDESIAQAADKVLEAEKGTALRAVLQEARKIVQKDQADHDEAVLKEYRQKRNESAAQRKYRKAIQREVKTLRDWLVNPDNKNALKHIPDVLKGPVGSFIAAIDLTSTNGGTQADERMAKKMQAVLDAYKRHIDDVGGLYSGYTDLPPDFVDRLTEMVNKTWQITRSGSDTYKIRGGEMSAADLRELYHLIREMKRHITTVNRFHANAMFQFASDAAQDTMKHLGKMGKYQNTALDGADQFLYWKNVRPAYIFERFGKGGVAIYDGLRRGQGQLARNTQDIKEFSDKAYKAEEVNAWEKEVKRVKLPSGGSIRLTVAQMMSLYCLSKREQALPHLLGGGIRGANIQGTDTEAQHLTMEDIQAICDRLTKRQRAVADNLQKFMSEQGGEWGNAVTVKRFGERQFTEEHYFPISTDGQLRNAEADKPDGSDLYALLNMSFTKKLTPNANNRVMLYSVFDVFTNHMGAMAQYNAMALPVLDALKWFNYRETWKTTDGKPAQDSVREQMVRAFGSPVSKEGVKDGKGYAEQFVLNILRGYNGTEAQGTPNDGMGMKTLHRYNRAQVAWNLSVVAKQPLAILRAAQEIPYTAIARGLAASPAQRKADIAEMLKHSGIATWKDLGFYDVNVSRGLSKIIKHNDTAIDKYVEKGMAGAEWADRQTWAAIWSACRHQCGGNLAKTTELFEQVIYKTQVVDSILTKTEYMRDKGFYSRLTSSFMSEPVTAVSPFLETAYRIKAEAGRKGGSFQTAWRKHGGKLGRLAYVYGVTAVMTGVLQSLIDAWRDDDEYQTFGEKFLEVLGGNIGEELNPVEKLPVIKEIGTALSAMFAKARGEDVWLQISTLPLGDVAEYATDATEILMKKLKGQNTGYTWYGSIRKYLQAASGLTGVPLATPTREAVDIWNNIVGRMAPSLKAKTYEQKPADALRDAFLAGFVDEDEATDKLMELGKAEDENEAYWKLRGWEGGSEWNKYDALEQAMANGEDISGAMDELTTHGVKEKDVREQIREIVGDWLEQGAVTPEEAERLLVRYGDRDSEEAGAAVQKWRCEIDTGIPYSGIKEAYLDGEITDTEAERMYVKYGGYTQEKAEDAVEQWRAEKDTGIAYSDIDDALLEGRITEREAAQMYETYGGMEPEEAAEAAHRLDFIRRNPGCEDISSAAVEGYEAHCEGAGITAKVYYDAWKQFDDTHSIKDENGKTVTSKRDQVMEQIHAMNLSKAQKDALYFAFGYAESKLWDTPWH